MFDWIMRTRTGAWLVALLAAAGLLAIGFGLAGDYYRGELQRWQERATQAEIRANRMQEQALLSRGTGLPAKQPKADSLLPQTIVAELRLAQPAEFLNGRVNLTLEEINPAAQRARLRVKVDERQGVVVVGAGRKVTFRLDGILYQLALRQTGTSSATIALIPQ